MSWDMHFIGVVKKQQLKRDKKIKFEKDFMYVEYYSDKLNDLCRSGFYAQFDSDFELCYGTVSYANETDYILRYLFEKYGVYTYDDNGDWRYEVNMEEEERRLYNIYKRFNAFKNSGYISSDDIDLVNAFKEYKANEKEINLILKKYNI